MSSKAGGIGTGLGQEGLDAVGGRPITDYGAQSERQGLPSQGKGASILYACRIELGEHGMEVGRQGKVWPQGGGEGGAYS